MPVSVLRLPSLPASAGKQHWGNLPGAALSLAVAEAASSAKRFTLLLTADSQNAERLEQELRFFAPDLPVLHFPDWETLPYDVFSPHQDIISQRIAALYQLPQLKHGVLVVPISTALHRLAPTRFLLGSSLVLDVGQKLDVERMRLRLEGAGYRCVDTVYEHGEFAVRGALIDLFPMGSELPFRIDLFDDETCRKTPRCSPCPASNRPRSSSGMTYAAATRTAGSIRNGHCCRRRKCSFRWKTASPG